MRYKKTLSAPPRPDRPAAYVVVPTTSHGSEKLVDATCRVGGDCSVCKLYLPVVSGKPKNERAKREIPHQNRHYSLLEAVPLA